MNIISTRKVFEIWNSWKPRCMAHKYLHKNVRPSSKSILRIFSSDSPKSTKAYKHTSLHLSLFLSLSQGNCILRIVYLNPKLKPTKKEYLSIRSTRRILLMQLNAWVYYVCEYKFTIISNLVLIVILVNRLFHFTDVFVNCYLTKNCFYVCSIIVF